jgi:hypothetical protein
MAEDMLLMLDYGIYYEFIPMNQVGTEYPDALNLSQVELNTNYAMVITTNAGLWRYMIGDTIQFTSCHPYRIRISGRTRNFINAFGEELIIDNADKAMAIACERSHAIVAEYTAGPVYLSGNQKGAHEWIIEFERTPDDLSFFTEALDTALKSLNSDYEAKRYHGLMLDEPRIISVPEHTFYNWLKSKGKLGGQHKVPRLANDRKYIDEILNLIAAG